MSGFNDFIYLFTKTNRHLANMSKIRHFLNAPSRELVQNDHRGIPQLFSHTKTIKKQRFLNFFSLWGGCSPPFCLVIISPPARGRLPAGLRPGACRRYGTDEVYYTRRRPVYSSSVPQRRWLATRHRVQNIRNN